MTAWLLDCARVAAFFVPVYLLLYIYYEITLGRRSRHSYSADGVISVADEAQALVLGSRIGSAVRALAYVVAIGALTVLPDLPRWLVAPALFVASMWILERHPAVSTLVYRSKVGSYTMAFIPQTAIAYRVPDQTISSA